jgi:hypothetical protein
MKYDSKNTHRIPSKSRTCVICSEPIDIIVRNSDEKVLWEDGCNAEPVADGRCCSYCDQEVVIPTRIQIMLAQKRAEIEKQRRK